MQQRWLLLLLPCLSCVAGIQIAYYTDRLPVVEHKEVKTRILMNSGVGSLVIRQPVRVWQGYVYNLDRHPVLTKTFTSAVAAVLGDALAQYASRVSISRNKWKYDWGRTARLTAFQSLLMGPFGHFYYTALDGSVMPARSKSPAAIAIKIMIDQLIFAPVTTVLFYAWKCGSEGRPRELRRELKKKYLPTLVANWKLWPAAHLVNFALIPTNQRILYANVVSVLGVYILSRAAAGDLSMQKLRSDSKQHLVQLQPIPVHGGSSALEENILVHDE